MITISIEGRFLDVREGEEKRFFINKTLHDLRDMFGRNSDRSRSIVLPRSPNNIAILAGHSARIGQDYRALLCQVFMSGVPILEDAQLVIIGEDVNHYEATIIGGAATFYNSLPDASIQDLDFSTDDFEWTLANYMARVNNTSHLVTAWAQWITNESYQKYLDEGGVSTEEQEATDIDKAGFCYYTKDIMSKIFAQLPLEIELDIDGALQDYNTLAIICPMPQIFDGHESSNDDAGLVGFNDNWPVLPFATWLKIPFDRVDENEGLVWDVVNHWYTPNISMPIRLRATIRRTALVVNQQLLVRLIKLPLGQAPIILETGAWSIITTLMYFDTFDIGAPGDRYYLEAFSTSQNYVIATESTNFRFTNQASASRDVEISNYLPDISQRDLVKNVFNLFHIVVSDISGKITLSLFDKIEQKPQVNLETRLASDRQIKYSPRLQDYGQINHFKYKDEPLVIGRAFNDIIQILNNTLPLEAIKIELAFAGSDGSLFQVPGRVAPSFEIEYQREENNNIHIIGGGGGAFATYNTNEANDLADNDIIFAEDGGTPMRFVVKRTFDNKNGELTYTGAINTNPPDWAFSHYELLPHEFQLAKLVSATGGSGVFVHYQGTERAEALIIRYTDIFAWDYLLERYYPTYKRMIEDIQLIHLWVDIPNTVFLELNSLAPIYILGGTYYLNKTEQYKLNGLTRLELLRFN